MNTCYLYVLFLFQVYEDAHKYYDGKCITNHPFLIMQIIKYRTGVFFVKALDFIDMASPYFVS